jgi:hypothetical protein
MFIRAKYSPQYSNEYDSDDDSDDERDVRILPAGRNVFKTSHGASAIDFEQVKWLLRYGTTELWYEKPSNAVLKRMRRAEADGNEADELASSAARPAELQMPKVWASAALTTPTNKKMHVCAAAHKHDSNEDSLVMTCRRCTDKKANALQATELAYCLVFSTTQIPEFMPPNPTAGKQMYKLIKCGSREAAVAEVFHVVGLNGWNLVFSCVMRASDDIEEQSGKFKRVGDLWMLAGADHDGEDGVRVFY